MKKPLFNIKLYLHSLGELKFAGIILFILALLGCVLPVFTRASGGGMVSYGVTSAPLATSAAMFAPALIAYMFIGSPILVFLAFRFLFNRRESDYYHSLPHSRISLCTSIAAATLTWIIVTITASVFLTLLCFKISGLIFNSGYVPSILAFYLASSIMVAGASLIGVSLTGGLLPAAIVTGLVLFLPRTISVIFTRAVQILAPVSAIRDLGILTNPAYHLPTALIWRVFNFMPIGMSPAELFLNTGGIIYTAIIGSAYLLLGGLAFVKRKSETAGMSAQNITWQHVIRCSLGLFLLMPVAYYSFTQFDISYIRHNTYINISNTSMMLIFAATSAAAYFLYELLATKSGKSMLKAIPHYIGIVVLALLITLGANAYGKYVLNIIPEPDDVAYITMQSSDIFYINEFRHPVQTYADTAVESVRFQNEDMKRLLLDTMRSGQSYQMDGSYRTCVYAFHMKNGRTITRAIKLPETRMEELMELQMDNDEYRSLYRSLPEGQYIDRITLLEVEDGNAEAVWDLLKSELQDLSDREYLSLTYDNFRRLLDWDYYNGANDIGGIYVKGELNGSRFSSYYSLTYLTPMALCEYLNQFNAAGINEAKEIFKLIGRNEQSYECYLNIIADVKYPLSNGDATLYIYDTGKDRQSIDEKDVGFPTPTPTPSPLTIGSPDSELYEGIDEGQRQKVLDIINANLGGIIDIEKPLIRVELRINENNYNVRDIEVYINVSEAELKELTGIIGIS